MPETTRDLVDLDLQARVRARMALVDDREPLASVDDLDDDDAETERVDGRSTRPAAAL